MSHSECAGCHSSLPCNCCVGAEILTPQPIVNRPGLSALKYRAGTHGSFLATMQARLASSDFPMLRGLTTRAANDPAMAMLDAWATVADVLTFYQERIANEGYLRTATERRSVLELAHLVGYALRPGVASSVYLAYTVDDNQTEPVAIPAGARAQSIPAPGELPQSFETGEKFVARREWNNLQPRMTQPQVITFDNVNTLERIYFEGISTNLKPNDLLLFVFKDEKVKRNVHEVKVLFTENKTEVWLQSAANHNQKKSRTSIGKIINSLQHTLILQPRNKYFLARDEKKLFAKRGDVKSQLITNIFSQLDSQTYYRALANAALNPKEGELQSVHVFRQSAALFGYNAPLEVSFDNGKSVKMPEWTLADDEAVGNLFLESPNENILKDSYVAIVDEVFKVSSAMTKPRSAYNVIAKTTEITLLNDTWRKVPDPKPDISLIRQTIVHLQSEELKLAEEPIIEDISSSTIKLGALYNGLQAGHWVIVNGERTDILGVKGIKASELVMIASARQEFNKKLPGDKVLTTILLAEKLTYTYKRDTVTIYGNIVKATHGETRIEVLGSGDGSKVFQKFDLRQAPLTYLPAPTTAGAASTLTLFVNEVKWHEADALAGLSNTAHNFITQTDDEGKTSAIFGDGKQGARLSSGRENIKAVYRSGIGKAGNVKAEQISLLSTRPLGVKGVINPLRASGGADKESRDLARRNAPLAVLPLDRLVSVKDYEDFTRLYAGIGKASAQKLSDGQRQLVHVSIAGVDDVPIDASSDLYRNLQKALHESGDPHLQIQLEVRELMLLVIAANITIHPDYQWEIVAQKIRAVMLDTFSFARRELGQSVYLSEVISTMQNIAGVESVDVDLLQGISEEDVKDAAKLKTKLSEITATTTPLQQIPVRLAALDQSAIKPAQIAFLSPQIPDTLILNLRSSQP